MLGPDMTAEPDLYAVLGLPRHATPAQVSHAYRTLLRQHHPDTRTPQPHAASASLLQQVQHAYARLHDPPRRNDYDLRTTPAPSPSAGQNLQPRRIPGPGHPDAGLLIQAGPVHWYPSQPAPRG